MELLDEGRPVSIGEAAKRLGVHPVTLRRWVRKGQLQAIRLPSGRLRFRVTELLRVVGVGAADLQRLQKTREEAGIAEGPEC